MRSFVAILAAAASLQGTFAAPFNEKPQPHTTVKTVTRSGFLPHGHLPPTGGIRHPGHHTDERHHHPHHHSTKTSAAAKPTTAPHIVRDEEEKRADEHHHPGAAHPTGHHPHPHHKPHPHKPHKPHKPHPSGGFPHPQPKHHPTGHHAKHHPGKPHHHPTKTSGAAKPTGTMHILKDREEKAYPTVKPYPHPHVTLKPGELGKPHYPEPRPHHPKPHDDKGKPKPTSTTSTKKAQPTARAEDDAVLMREREVLQEMPRVVQEGN